MSKWIILEDDMPECRDVVLVTDGSSVGYAYWQESKWGHGWREVRPLSGLPDYITHWMPLPELPLEKK